MTFEAYASLTACMMKQRGPLCSHELLRFDSPSILIKAMVGRQILNQRPFRFDQHVRRSHERYLK